MQPKTYYKSPAGIYLNNIALTCAFGLVQICKSKSIKPMHSTLLVAEILSGKNARAWVSMDFT